MSLNSGKVKKATKWRAEITTAQREFKKYNRIPILQHTTREQLAYTVRDKGREPETINLRAGRASLSFVRDF